ncbi:MAG: TusE/DsrC/DsvC family sulfur relay protein [Gammaproteobacteria bacterium]|nr:TusE/DsrC/DsvC family sulfur relay protein [Gammaproteobacteria bacterium]
MSHAIGNNLFNTNDEGFLTNSEQWDESVALKLAESDDFEITDAHWEIIRFIREYYLQYEHLPNARLFVKAVKTKLGPEKGNSLYLYRLFPDGPAKFACKYAGLAKPPGCL